MSTRTELFDVLATKHTHTHTPFNGQFPGEPGLASCPRSYFPSPFVPVLYIISGQSKSFQYPLNTIPPCQCNDKTKLYSKTTTFTIYTAVMHSLPAQWFRLGNPGSAGTFGVCVSTQCANCYIMALWRELGQLIVNDGVGDGDCVRDERRYID